MNINNVDQESNNTLADLEVGGGGFSLPPIFKYPMKMK